MGDLDWQTDQNADRAAMLPPCGIQADPREESGGAVSKMAVQISYSTTAAAV